MITLQTPGTGFDDFESRIALGLCRVALDCVEPEQVTLEESFDRYLIHINIDEGKKDNLVKSLSWWCLRTLSDRSSLLRIIGFRPKGIDIQTEKISKHGLAIQNKQNDILQFYNLTLSKTIRKGSHDLICGHKKTEKFPAILAFSPSLGSPPIRNNPVRSTNPPDLCIYCGTLSVLGITSFQVNMQINNKKKIKETISFIPRFRSQTSGRALSQYIAAIKNITIRLASIPSISASLGLLSSYPHIARILSENVKTIFIARGEYTNPPGVWRYNFSEERNIDAELKFLGDNPYNVALAQSAYRYTEDKPELLGLLSKTLQFKRNQDAVSFCREYVSTTKGKQLVYKESVKYIAKEVLDMDEKLIDDPNIGAVAKMLKYFVSKQNFGPVDYLRGSQTPEEFAKYLLDAHRKAAGIYSKPDEKKDKKEKELFFPSEDNVREVLKLSESNFEQVKILTCILAFTYWRKEG